MERPTCGKVKGCRMQFTVVFHREIGVFGPQIGQNFLRGAPPRTPLGLCPRPQPPKSATLAATIIPVTPEGESPPQETSITRDPLTFSL